MSHSIETLKNFDYQREYLWEIILPDIGGISGLDIAIYCQSIKFGDYDIIDLKRIRYGAFKRGYVDFLDIESIDIKILKPVYADIVTAYFKAWKQLIVSDDGYYGVKSEYARTITINLLDRMGNITLSYRGTGVYPRKFPAFDLDYKKEGNVEYIITFNIDTLTIV